MFRRKKKPSERLPWYRARVYKGNLTENEKQELDSFRMRANHPAVSYDSLPTEVKNYINKLEMEVYDKKQEALALTCLVSSGLGGFFLVRYALGYDESSELKHVGSVLLLIVPWIYYRIKWQKNADEFLPKNQPNFPTDEALRTEWESDYIADKRSVERQERSRTH